MPVIRPVVKNVKTKYITKRQNENQRKHNSKAVAPSPKQVCNRFVKQFLSNS